MKARTASAQEIQSNAKKKKPQQNPDFQNLMQIKDSFRFPLPSKTSSTNEARTLASKNQQHQSAADLNQPSLITAGLLPVSSSLAGNQAMIFHQSSQNVQQRKVLKAKIIRKVKVIKQNQASSNENQTKPSGPEDRQIQSFLRLADGNAVGSAANSRLEQDHKSAGNEGESSIAGRAKSRQTRPQYRIDPSSERLPAGSTSKVVDATSDRARMAEDVDTDRNPNLASESQSPISRIDQKSLNIQLNQGKHGISELNKDDSDGEDQGLMSPWSLHAAEEDARNYPPHPTLQIVPNMLTPANNSQIESYNEKQWMNQENADDGTSIQYNSENMESDCDDVQNSQISQKQEIRNERKILGLSGEIRSKGNKLKADKSLDTLRHKASIHGPDSRDVAVPRIGGSTNQIPKVNTANKPKKLKLKNIGKLNLDIEAIEEANRHEFSGHAQNDNAALKALNSLQNIEYKNGPQFEDFEDFEEEQFPQEIEINHSPVNANIRAPYSVQAMVALKSSPKKQFLAETRLLAGISRIIDKSSEISNDETENHENLIDDNDESNIEDCDKEEDDDLEEAEVPPDTARSAGGTHGNHHDRGSKIQNHIPNSQSQCNLKGRQDHNCSRKINMLNTQKYSSIANKQFHANKINNQLFSNHGQQSSISDNKQKINGMNSNNEETNNLISNYNSNQNRGNHQRNQRFDPQYCGKDKKDRDKVGGPPSAANFSLSQTRKVIQLNLKTPNNFKKSKNSQRNIFFKAEQFLDEQQDGNPMQTLPNNEEAKNLPQSAKLLQMTGQLTMGTQNKSMLSSIHGENLQMNQIRESLENRGVGMLAAVSKNQKSSLEKMRSASMNRRVIVNNASKQIELQLPSRKLSRLDFSMLNMHLKKINLSKNQITELPKEICMLVNLQYLNLESNYLNRLPFDEVQQIKNKTEEDWSNLKSLEVLNIIDNNIQVLPPNIGSCSKLKSLFLTKNKLCQIPSSIAELQNIQSLSLEWFMYLDPPQFMSQKGEQGAYVIGQLKEFCSASIQLSDSIARSQEENKKWNQRSFGEFLCYFHICKKIKGQKLSQAVIEKHFNENMRFSLKKRCITQAICSNKHAHLLQEIIMTKNPNPNLITSTINQLIDLNIKDTQNQTPILAAFRQLTSEYANILLEILELEKERFENEILNDDDRKYTKKLPNLNEFHEKHGYPLHIAILSHRFDIAYRMMKLGKSDAIVGGTEFPYAVDTSVTSSIGANIVHLLLVKYDKDCDLAKKILEECVQSKSIDLNLIDSLKAAPMHVGIKKKQHQALRDCVQINKNEGRQVFDLNILDKRGYTPLHYVIEKGDYDMFTVLLADPYIDVFALDDNLLKPRRISVIFSAFHKVLYTREKLYIRKLFQKCLNTDFVDFHSVRKLKPSITYSGAANDTPQPVAVINKVRCDLDLSGRPIERLFLKNTLINSMKNSELHNQSVRDIMKNAASKRAMNSWARAPPQISERNFQSLYYNENKETVGDRSKEISKKQAICTRYQEKFMNINDHRQFYAHFEEDDNFVEHQLFNFRQMKKFGISDNLMHNWPAQARQNFPSQVLIGSNMEKQRVSRYNQVPSQNRQGIFNAGRQFSVQSLGMQNHQSQLQNRNWNQFVNNGKQLKSQLTFQQQQQLSIGKIQVQEPNLNQRMTQSTHKMRHNHKYSNSQSQIQIARNGEIFPQGQMQPASLLQRIQNDSDAEYKKMQQKKGGKLDPRTPRIYDAELSDKEDQSLPLHLDFINGQNKINEDKAGIIRQIQPQKQTDTANSIQQLKHMRLDGKALSKNQTEKNFVLVNQSHQSYNLGGQNIDDVSYQRNHQALSQKNFNQLNESSQMLEDVNQSKNGQIGASQQSQNYIINNRMKDQKFGPKMPFTSGEMVQNQYKNLEGMNFDRQISSHHIKSMNDDLQISQQNSSKSSLTHSDHGIYYKNSTDLNKHNDRNLNAEIQGIAKNLIGAQKQENQQQIIISNLNINYNNYVINMKDLSLPQESYQNDRVQYSQFNFQKPNQRYSKTEQDSDGGPLRSRAPSSPTPRSPRNLKYFNLATNVPTNTAADKHKEGQQRAAQNGKIIKPDVFQTARNYQQKKSQYYQQVLNSSDIKEDQTPRIYRANIPQIEYQANLKSQINGQAASQRSLHTNTSESSKAAIARSKKQYLKSVEKVVHNNLQNLQNNAMLKSQEQQRSEAKQSRERNHHLRGPPEQPQSHQQTRRHDTQRTQNEEQMLNMRRFDKSAN